MRTIETNIYTFEELSESAKKLVIENLIDINTDYNWWKCTYEDAENIGLKLTSFRLDRNRDATGEFMLFPLEVAQNIINEHGESCDTHKLAQAFLAKHSPIYSDYLDENSENYESSELEEELQQIEEEFEKDLIEEYSIILQKEYEYLTSEESIIETIEANEYEFTENGELA